MIQVQIVGLEKLVGKLKGDALLGAPLRKAFTDSAALLEREAKLRAPVDTGGLRSRITHAVDGAPVPLWGKMGTNVFYAPYMEFGTGTMAEGKGGKGGRHQPPSGALDLWARRHGIPSGFLVARAIGRRGGLKPRRYLRGALEGNLGKIQGFFNACARAIEAAWGK